MYKFDFTDNLIFILFTLTVFFMVLVIVTSARDSLSTDFKQCLQVTSRDFNQALTHEQLATCNSIINSRTTEK